MTNNILKSRPNYKNICMIISIIFFILGFILGKTTISFGATGIIYPANETRVYSDSNIQFQEKSAYNGAATGTAKPYIPVTMDMYETGANVGLSLSDSTDTLNFNSFIISQYNLNVTYPSTFNGFVELTIHILNPLTNILDEEKVTMPVIAGKSNYVVPNFKAKTHYNKLTGQSINYSYPMIVCVGVRKLFIY